ncbi:PAS domain-containing protein [Zavarzinia sp. CC-PAN008]|uniref:PAS domain-containing protein n=1 Tax=Zavarzinia sp. CC-PAN008 TaxID=3243332 RepID=UPI003F742E39
MPTLDDLQHRLARSPVMQQFVATWRGLRAGGVDQGGLMPEHGRFNPMRFGRTLAWISLMDLVDDDHLIYRIAARELEQALGYTLKGVNSLDHLMPEQRPIRIWRYGQVLEQPCGLYALHSSKTRHGLVINGELVALPLNTSRGGRGQILTCGVPLGEAEQVAEFTGPDLGLAHTLTFVDIGAGVPPSLVPAA